MTPNQPAPSPEAAERLSEGELKAILYRRTHNRPIDPADIDALFFHIAALDAEIAALKADLAASDQEKAPLQQRLAAPVADRKAFGKQAAELFEKSFKDADCLLKSLSEWDASGEPRKQAWCNVAEHFFAAGCAEAQQRLAALAQELAALQSQLHDYKLAATEEAAAHDAARQGLANVKDERDRAHDMLRQSEANGNAMMQELAANASELRGCGDHREFFDRGVEYLRLAKEAFIAGNTCAGPSFRKAAEIEADCQIACMDLDHQYIEPDDDPVIEVAAIPKAAMADLRARLDLAEANLAEREGMAAAMREAIEGIVETRAKLYVNDSSLDAAIDAAKLTLSSSAGKSVAERLAKME